MSFFRKIGNGLARFMYGRNGLDQLNLTLIWSCLILDVVAMFLVRASVLAGNILYYASFALWIWAIFRIFSRNVTRRRMENSRFLALVGKLRNREARARRADREHRYFTCRQCGTICRVPVGKGKIVITCPKCGAEIRTKT